MGQFARLVEEGQASLAELDDASGEAGRGLHDEIRTVEVRRPHVGPKRRAHEHAVPVTRMTPNQDFGREHVLVAISERAFRNAQLRPGEALIFTRRLSNLLTMRVYPSRSPNDSDTWRVPTRNWLRRRVSNPRPGG